MRALITGSSHGLGRELARSFIDAGWTVTGTTHNLANINEMEQYKYFQFDPMEDPALAVSNLVNQLSVVPYDLLINNAGVNAIRPFKDLDAEFIQEIMNVNFMAPVLLVRDMLDQRLLAKPAIVINIISDAAWRPMRHSLAYNCSKAALDMATKQMARELTKPEKLTVVGIRPGKMHGTEMSRYIDDSVCRMRGWSQEQAFEYWMQNSVSGVEIQPEKLADTICHLVSSGMVYAMSGACVDLAG